MENPIQYTASELSPQDRMVSMWMHLGPLLANFLNFMVPIPFLSLLATVILYNLHRDKGGMVLENGKESVNFQITLAIIWIVYIIVAAMVVGKVFVDLYQDGFDGDNFDLGSGLSVGFGVLPLIGVASIIWIFSIIVMLIGSVRGNEGKIYRYPLSIKFVK